MEISSNVSNINFTNKNDATSIEKKVTLIRCSKCAHIGLKTVCYDCADYTEKSNKEGNKKSFFADKTSDASFALQNGQFFSLAEKNEYVILTLKNIDYISSNQITNIQFSINQANILQLHLYRLIRKKKEEARQVKTDALGYA